MGVYAGFLEHTDTQYGRVVDELERQGVLNNTIIIYVGSDNGASAEGIEGTISAMLAINGVDVDLDDQLEVLDEWYGGIDALGGPMVDNMYHHGWAWAGNTPFQSTKLVAGHLGGSRTPLAISFPNRLKHDPTPRTQFSHVIDIAPTIYDLLNITAPTVVEGTSQDPIQGTSMLYTFTEPEAESRHKVQYFEVMTSRGIYDAPWFAAVGLGARIPWAPHLVKTDWNPSNDTWELYNLETDWSQVVDVADQYPEKLEEMKALYLEEASKNKVLPEGAGLYIVSYHPDEARATNLTEWTLFPSMSRINEPNAPKYITGFDSQATIRVEIPADEGKGGGNTRNSTPTTTTTTPDSSRNKSDGDDRRLTTDDSVTHKSGTSEKAVNSITTPEGVLYALGGIMGGVTVYVLDGHLRAEYNTLGIYRYVAKDPNPLPRGVPLLITVDMTWESKNSPGSAGLLALSVNGTQVAKVVVEKSVPGVFTGAETFDIGKDTGSPVALEYFDRVPFAFNGKLESVHIKYV